MRVTLPKPESIAEPFAIAFAYAESEPFAIGESIVLREPDAGAKSLGTPLPDGECANFWAIGGERGRGGVSGWRARVRVPPVRERAEFRPASERGFRAIGTWALYVTHRDRYRRYGISSCPSRERTRIGPVQPLALPRDNRGRPVIRARAVGCRHEVGLSVRENQCKLSLKPRRTDLLLRNVGPDLQAVRVAADVVPQLRSLRPSGVRSTIAIAFGVSVRRLRLARWEISIAFGRRLATGPSLVIKPRRKAYGNEDVREDRVSSGGDAVEGEGRVPRGDALIASPPPFLEGRTPGGEVPERPTQCTRSTPSGK